jgi:hypothetical protein
MPAMYYEPKDDVFSGSVGRKLDNPNEIPRPYAHYLGLLREGEFLYAALRGDAVPPRIVAWVYDQASYDDYYGRYMSGHYRFIDFYAIRDDARPRLAQGSELGVLVGSRIWRTDAAFGADYTGEEIPQGADLEVLLVDISVIVREFTSRTVYRFPRLYLREPWFQVHAR